MFPGYSMYDLHIYNAADEVSVDARPKDKKALEEKLVQALTYLFKDQFLIQINDAKTDKEVGIILNVNINENVTDNNFFCITFSDN